MTLRKQMMIYLVAAAVADAFSSVGFTTFAFDVFANSRASLFSPLLSPLSWQPLSLASSWFSQLEPLWIVSSSP
jgi:hypothetical protein